MLSELIDPDGLSTRMRYDALGRRTQLRHPNGVTGAYTYNARSELLSLSWASSTSVLSASAYGYSARKSRSTRTYEDGGVERYDYDALSRLVGVTYPGGERRVTYEYDPVGNRLRLEQLTSGAAETIPAGCQPVDIVVCRACQGVG